MLRALEGATVSELEMTGNGKPLFFKLFMAKTKIMVKSRKLMDHIIISQWITQRRKERISSRDSAGGAKNDPIM